MSGLLKLGVYIAAGVGTYELLRRTGLLEKATDWLEQQIPQDLKDKALDFRDRAQQHAEDMATQAQDAVRRATGYDGEDADADQPAAAGNGHHGQTITGQGRGAPVTTDDYGGLHASHNVGRGVVR